MGQSAFFCFSFSHLQDSTNNDKTIKLNIQTSFSELVLSTYREIKRRLAAFKTCPFVNAIMWKVLESKSTETCVLTRTNDWKFDWNKRINTFLLLFGPCKQLWCCDHNNSCKFNQSLWILHNMPIVSKLQLVCKVLLPTSSTVTANIIHVFLTD